MLYKEVVKVVQGLKIFTSHSLHCLPLPTFMHMVYAPAPARLLYTPAEEQKMKDLPAVFWGCSRGDPGKTGFQVIFGSKTKFQKLAWAFQAVSGSKPNFHPMGIVKPAHLTIKQLFTNMGMSKPSVLTFTKVHM